MRYPVSAHRGIQRGFCVVFLLLAVAAFHETAHAGTGQLLVSPSIVNFGNVALGSSQTQSVTLTNSGGPKITVSQISLSGTGFTVSGVICPITLAGGQSVTFAITFAPPFTGADSGSASIIVSTQSSGGKKTNSASISTAATVALSGTGISSGQLAGSPSSITFSSVQVGNSQSVPETITNSGGATVTISAINVTGSAFGTSGLALPFTLAVGQSVNLSLSFSPNSAGTVTGTLAITSDAANSALNIPLSGTAVTPGQLAASATSLSFGSVATGSSSTATETLTNVGGSALTISQVATSGTGFSLTGIAPPVTLSAGQSISFTVAFAPLVGGTATGSLVVSSNGSNPTLSIPLSGSGIAPGQLIISPTSINFGNVVEGTTQAQSATLTASNGPVTVSSATVSQSQFALSGIAFPVTIPAGYTMSFSVTFAPQATGSASANVTFGSNASNGPTAQSVTGSGTAPQHSVALNWSPSTSTNIAGYNIYRGSVSGGPYLQINSSLDPATTDTDASVQAGQTYYYVVAAVDSTGSESAYSNQVAAVIPSP